MAETNDLSQKPTTFYRYEAVEYAVLGGDGDFVSARIPNPRIELREYDLKRETPKGYWIGYKNFDDFEKWVSKTSVKRFAYPTKKEAMTNFIKRTERRIEILQAQMDSAKAAVRKAKTMDLENGTVNIF